MMGVFGKEGGRGERETRGGEAQEGHQKVISGGTKKKRGGNYRKPKKRPLKKPRTRKSLKKKKRWKKNYEKTFVNDLFMQKKPFVFSFYRCSCPITFPPCTFSLPVPLHVLPPCLPSCTLFLLPLPLPFPTQRSFTISSLTHLPSPSPSHPPDAILYYTIPSHSIFRSVLLYISCLEAKREGKMFVCIESY